MLHRQAAGDLAKVSLRPRGHDDGSGRAGLDAGAQKAKIASFDGRDILACVSRIRLFHGHGFAGKRGLNDEQILGRKQSHVAGHHIAAGELDHVARDKLLERDFFGLPLTHHRGGDTDHRLEFGRRRVGAGFLNEAQRQAQSHHRQHDAAAQIIAPGLRGGKGENRQHQQQDDQRIAGGEIEPLRPPMLFFPRHRIGTVLFEARRGFGFGQSGRASTQRLQDLSGCLRRHLTGPVRGALAIGAFQGLHTITSDCR